MVSPRNISPAGNNGLRSARLAALWVVAIAALNLHPGGPGATFGLGATGARAQGVEATNIFGEQELSGDEQLLLESDELVFDNDRGLVIASGNVQIAFGRTSLVADRVEYNQQSGRVIASGSVEILEANGNRIFAEEIDITDDFRDGFVSALNIETTDNTRIAAESAERRDGQITQFNNGVYTACEKCEKNPEKPPFWQIRAQKVVVNNQERTIEYEDASLEFFGRPIVRLSRFSHADPAIRRKSGLLIPEISQSEELGFGYKQGYFFNLAPNYDVTVWGSYYDRQGFLGEAEWRHRVANGEYSIRYAGIDQQEPDAFNARFIDSTVDDRHAVITSGLFDINDRWQFGWNALFQTDDNFARTYELQGNKDRDVTNEVFLTGIGEKNYFDLSAEDYLVQDNLIDAVSALPGDQSFTDQQATLLPLLDYNAVTGDEFEYGQVSLDVNVANINRGAPQIDNFDIDPVVEANERFHGIEGQFTRFSSEIEWKASNISSAGAVVTTSFSARGDAIFQQNDMPATAFNPLTSDESIFRFMPAAMLEIRYPLIAQSGTASHIFEPIAQVIARPDETNIGDFANEDAQSLVFDTSNLFERDKFSGFDRVEGGTRANVGFRYAASFQDMGYLNLTAGQSFQLAGDNSFANTDDLVNVGTESGLETTRSDYVASVQFNNQLGIGAGVGVRLDEEDLGLKRLEANTSIKQEDAFSLKATYIFAEAQPNSRSILTPSSPEPRDRQEISGSGSFHIDENWEVFGGITYDIETDTIIRDQVGLRYENDCFTFSIAYRDLNETFNGTSNSNTIDFAIGLRTIGGFRQSLDFGDGDGDS